MSFHLAQALRSGRKPPTTPVSREIILARLLRKRAAAAQAGLSELESQLRSQIRWALPIQQPSDGDSAEDASESGEA